MSVRKKLDGVLNVGDTITKALAAAKKKAKDAADKVKNLNKQRNAKGNATNYFTDTSPNQDKVPVDKQQRFKNAIINTRLKDIAVGGVVLATAAAMSKDKKLEKKANTAYSNDANTFTFNKKEYKTPTKAVLNKVASPKKESTPPEPPKSRPKVGDTKKQLMMKEKYSGKDSEVKFNAKGGMMKKYSKGGMTKKGKK
jgi:hypothetical protein